MATAARICPEAAAGALLQIRNLGYRRGQGDQVFFVQLPRLDLERGETLAVTGESGSGKSTLLELLGLVAAPLPGAEFVWRTDGVAAQEMDLARLWRRRDHAALSAMRAAHIGFVMQTGGLLPYMTIRQNIGINLRLLGLADAGAQVAHLIAALGLEHSLDKRPAQLSIGQQQRASIARALAHAPALLLADEPTSALDPRSAHRVTDLLQALAREQGTTVVIVTHDQQRVRESQLRELHATPIDVAGLPGSRFEE